ncbi:MAG: hypothetical protein GY749_24370 [Desulfobacteraceae bacterium]|nr:hypothetical protein [Desulfobacteraceae bacterium]
MHVMSDYPYPGIRAFTRDETDIFFGREKQADELIERLGAARFLAVVGASGCGKSSLVRTGMIAGLETGFLAKAGARWKVAEIRPGSQPFYNLADALCHEETPLGNAPDREGLESFLRQGALSLHELLSLHPLDGGTNLLIVVDQFEELFRYADDSRTRAEASAFAALLLASSRPYPLPDGRVSHRVYVVITMRSDFIGDCARFSGLAEAINDGLYLTPRLTREQLREAVEEPPAVVGCEIEPGLVRQLVSDAGDDPDQLPLIQHVLQWMWLQAKEKGAAGQVYLGLGDYERMGRFGRALSDRLDGIYNGLPDSQKRIAEVMFRSLSKRDTEQRDIRRPVRLGRVADLAGAGWKEAAEVVEAFRKEGRNFILSSEKDLNPDVMLDVCHESLLRQWETVKIWLEDEAKSADMYKRLENAALRREQGRGELWTGLDLSGAVEWRERTVPTRTWAVRYGLDEGRHFQKTMYFLEESVSAEKKARRKKRTLTGLFIVFLMFVAFVLFVQLERTRESEQKAVAAEEQTEALKQKRTLDLYGSHLTHASLLIRQGVEDYARAKEILKETVPLDQDVPDHRRHARNLLSWYAGMMGGEAEQVYKGAGYPLVTVAVSPDGKFLAAGGEKGTLVIFDAVTGELLKRLDGHDKTAGDFGAVWSVAFHPQGKWLASGGEDSTIRLWSTETWEQNTKWDAPDKVNAVAFSLDGQILASGGDDNNITLRQTDTGKVLKTLKGHNSRISDPNGLSFSPDGKQLASASYDDTARLWDMKTGKTVHILRGHAANVQNAQFNSEGKLLATSSDDRTIIIWDVASGSPLRLLRGHQNTVFGIRFLDISGFDEQKSEYLISGSFDRTLRLWDVESGVTLRVWQGHEAGIGEIAIFPLSAPKLPQVFTNSNDGTVRRWKAELPYLRRISLPGEPCSSAISPNGDNIVVGFRNGSLRMYSINGTLLWEKEKVNDDKISRLAFNKDGSLLCSGSFDNTAKIWKVGDSQLEELQTLEGHINAIHAVAFSPDSRTLATASYDGRIGLFTIGAEEKRFIEKAHDGYVASVCFDVAGKYLLSSGNQDCATRLWKIKDHSLMKEFPKANGKLSWSALSPDGQKAAAVGRGSNVTVYTTHDAQVEHRLPGHEQTVFKAIFSPDSQQLATVAGDATLRFWDLSNGTELFTIRLPENAGKAIWDFDFRCTPTGCWITVPLTKGELLIYELGKIYD